MNLPQPGAGRTAAAKRILITGGAGFIGTHLAERFCSQHEVVLLDNFRRDSLSLAPELKSNPHVRLVTGDTLDPASLAATLEGAEVVFHLAAIAGVSSYYKEPLQTLDVNILGARNVLREAARSGVRQFIFFSTSEVFGADARQVSEQDPCGIGPSTDRRWVYATSKLAGEHFTLRFGEEHGFAATVVRPFNIYGPRQVGEGAISNFCRAAAARQPLTVYGDGAATRAWCYVSDLVDAMESLLASPQAAAGQVLNIGNPREVESTAGLAQRVARLVPGAEVRFQPVTRAEVRDRAPLIALAQRLLGYNPKVDLESGLRLTLEWFSSHKDRQP
jgi:nucleoside-diphosphate-sugar epimerase